MHKLMRKVATLMALGLIGGVAVAADFDFCVVDNDNTGDCRLLRIGDYMLDTPTTVTLIEVADTNGENRVTAYSVIAQIIYKDRQIPRPDGDTWPQAQRTGELLNEWLADYLAELCNGLDLDTLCEYYHTLEFVNSACEGFPEYVSAQIAKLPASQKLAIDTVTVTFNAVGAFGDELNRRFLKAE